MVRKMFKPYDLYLVAIYLIALFLTYANYEPAYVMTGLGVGCISYCLIRSLYEDL